MLPIGCVYACLPENRRLAEDRIINQQKQEKPPLNGYFFVLDEDQKIWHEIPYTLKRTEKFRLFRYVYDPHTKKVDLTFTQVKGNKGRGGRSTQKTRITASWTELLNAKPFVDAFQDTITDNILKIFANKPSNRNRNFDTTPPYWCIQHKDINNLFVMVDFGFIRDTSETLPSTFLTYFLESDELEHAIREIRQQKNVNDLFSKENSNQPTVENANTENSILNVHDSSCNKDNSKQSTVNNTDSAITRHRFALIAFIITVVIGTGLYCKLCILNSSISPST